MGKNMNKIKKQEYKTVEELRQFLEILQYQKFTLDCGHHVTFNRVLGNSITIQNGKKLIITCAECKY
jgi:hypothetical protein